jgi:hypothetical protein
LHAQTLQEPGGIPADASFKAGDGYLSGNFGESDDAESPLQQRRVRNAKVSFRNFKVPEQENIDIGGSRGITSLPPPSQLLFNRLALRKKVMRRAVELAPH